MEKPIMCPICKGMHYFRTVFPAKTGFHCWDCKDGSKVRQ